MMPETATKPTQPQAQKRRSDTGDKTTATSLTAAGLAAFLLWIFGMIDAGRFFVPPVETAMFMGAGILPIIQAFSKRWIREIEQPTTGGVNGHAPEQLDLDLSAGTVGK